MGERLKGDLARIGEVAAQITWIGAELDRATMVADGYASALGSPMLAAMLHAFAANWSIHRRRLVAELRALADLARALAVREVAI